MKEFLKIKELYFIQLNISYRPHLSINFLKFWDLPRPAVATVNILKAPARYISISREVSQQNKKLKIDCLNEFVFLVFTKDEPNN